MMKYTFYIIRRFVTNRHKSEAAGVGVAYLRWLQIRFVDFCIACI